MFIFADCSTNIIFSLVGTNDDRSFSSDRISTGQMMLERAKLATARPMERYCGLLKTPDIKSLQDIPTLPVWIIEYAWAQQKIEILEGMHRLSIFESKLLVGFNFAPRYLCHDGIESPKQTVITLYLLVTLHRSHSSFISYKSILKV